MNGAFTWQVRDGLLEVADDSGAVVFRGSPDGRSVWRANGRGSGQRGVVLLDPNASLDSNLLCVDVRGNALWAAELPDRTEADQFTNFELSGDELAAFTGYGFRVTLDAESGRVTSSE